MAWQGLHISRPARLRVRDGALDVEQDEGGVRFAFEDLDWMVLDTPQATASAAALGACADAGVLVVFCDARHLPCGALLPFHGHHQQGDVVARQLAASGPLRKRLWQRIVRAKIVNQASVLDAFGAGGAAVLAMAERVRSGDPDNVEARAARLYWSRLFEGFRRRASDDVRNALLNYGYAVVRAALARTLAAHGFLPVIGIHHRSERNAFNLADDLLEPYRPLVDAVAVARWEARDAEEKDLTLDDRRAMAGVLARECAMGAERVGLTDAATRSVQSLARALAASDAEALELPAFAPEAGGAAHAG